MNKLELQKTAVEVRKGIVTSVHSAKAGHPGGSLSAADIFTYLYFEEMNIDPKNPKKEDRDRFVLSKGHTAPGLYSVLANRGYFPVEDLVTLRHIGSYLQGHPDMKHIPGVDMSSGSLGQGISAAVGMALAEKHLAAVYNKPGYNVIDHFTYSLVGDGDLMEGLSEESLNIAGDKGLNKLIVLYDSNDVSLDGPLSLSTNENVKARVEAAGWDYSRVENGNTDIDAIFDAINAAKKTDKPSLIEIKTTIGYGAPGAGTHSVHGAPLGEDGVQQMRDFYGWSLAPFEFTDEIHSFFDKAVASKKPAYDEWQKMFADYKEKYPKEASQLTTSSLDVEGLETSYKPGDEIATRVASSEILQELAKNNPQFWGGAADLASSNKTYLADDGDFSADTPAGRNVFFGVREFGMATAVNGMNLHGGNRAYGSTFFVFTDYMRAAIRLAAIMHCPSIFIGSHDSIAVGEDGPTHEPIEQLASFRAMPDLNVIRPADANETLAAWKVIAKTTDRPSLLVTSRQKLPVLEQTIDAPVEKGAYIVSKEEGPQPDGILIAAGSEVSLALKAQKLLKEQGKDVRVVSMPSVNLFKEQDAEYQESILPKNIEKRMAIEMGASQSWYEFTGLHGKVMGIDRFGASGKGPKVIEEYGFTPEHVAEEFMEL